VSKIILDEEKEQVRTILEACSYLVEFLGSDWIKRRLLGENKRSEVHYLFWLLLDLEKSQKLENWLRNLKASLISTKFQGLVNDLKKKGNRAEFYSLLSEIEVLSYYSGEGFEVEYEPPHGDIMVVIDNHEIFIEIARLFSSKDRQRIDAPTNVVWEKLDELNNEIYVLSFSISRNFSESDVESFTNFVGEKLEEEFEKLPSEDFIFDRGKAKFQIIGATKRKKGYVGTSMTPVMEIPSARRLKGKILDEVKQLPKNTLNVVVYNISHIPTHFDDIEDAFLGQSVAVINRRTMKARWARKENGVIHKEEGKQVSMLIAYEDFRYEKRRKYANPNAEFQLSDQMLIRL